MMRCNATWRKVMYRYVISCTAVKHNIIYMMYYNVTSRNDAKYNATYCVSVSVAPVCLMKLSPANAKSSGFSLGKGLALIDRALGS